MSRKSEKIAAIQLAMKYLSPEQQAAAMDMIGKLQQGNKSGQMPADSIILEQLGGLDKLDAMLGLQDVMSLENGISFKIKYMGAKANYIKIELNPQDLYDVEIGNIKGYNYRIVANIKDVFANQLKEIIETTCEVRLSFD